MLFSGVLVLLKEKNVNFATASIAEQRTTTKKIPRPSNIFVICFVSFCMRWVALEDVFAIFLHFGTTDRRCGHSG